MDTHEHTIRLHEVDGVTRARVVSFFQSLPGSYMVVRETDAARSHYQAWSRCDVKQQALRKRINKSFPECVGNGGYSLGAVKEMDKWNRYLLKGTRTDLPDVVAYHGIELNAQSIAEAHAAYWAQLKETKTSKSTGTIVSTVEEWVKAQNWINPHAVDSGYAIAERVCDVITQKEKAMSLFYARGIYNTVMYRLDHNFRTNYISEVISKH